MMPPGPRTIPQVALAYKGATAALWFAASGLVHFTEDVAPPFTGTLLLAGLVLAVAAQSRAWGRRKRKDGL